MSSSIEPAIRIMIIDDQQLIVDSLEMLLDMVEGIDVVTTVTDSSMVIDTLAANPKVDLLLMDYHMPRLDGLQLTHQVKELYPDLKVLMLTVNEDAGDIQNAYAAGASGYVLKKVNRHELTKAIRAVSAGERYFGQGALQALMVQSDELDEIPSVSQAKLKSLTGREIEIIRYLSQELSSAEIAESLQISAGTVSTHRHNILRKLGVRTTIGIVKFAIKAGIVK
ncbi:MAG: response regulator transcription factor [Bacteroidota bacterium]